LPPQIDFFTKDENMTKQVRWTIIGLIILIIAGMIAYPRVKEKLKSEEKTQGPPPPAMAQRRMAISINAVVLKKQSLIDGDKTVGTTIPDEDVNLTFESSGKIIDIFFTEGSHVKKGDLLAKINDKPLQAELKKLESQLPLAKERVNRQGTLLEKDAVSLEAFEQVTTALEVLLADIELVKARLLQTELRAPFDGIIGLRQVSEGAYATPQTIIVNLTKISPLKIEFSVNERFGSEIRNGTDIVFNLETTTSGLRKEYKAKVYAVESKIALETRTLKVRALYPNEDGRILPGRNLQVDLIIKAMDDALVVPSEAVIPEMGKFIVYQYRNGEARAKTITPGLRTESHVQVLDGLLPGDTVITSGVMQLRTGMRVTIDNLR